MSSNKIKEMYPYGQFPACPFHFTYQTLTFICKHEPLPTPTCKSLKIVFINLCGIELMA